MIAGRAARFDAAAAAGFVLLLLLPGLRAYLPGLPNAVYLLPLAWLGLLALARRRAGGRLPGLPLLQLGLVVALALWLLLSSLWTISAEQVVTDAGLLLLLVASAAVGALVLDRAVVARLLPAFALAAAVCGLAVMAEFVAVGGLRTAGTRLAEVYLTVANILGAAATGAAIWYLTGPSLRSAWGLLALVLVLLLALALARGALISSMLIVLTVTVGWSLLRVREDGRAAAGGQGARRLGVAFGIMAAMVVTGLQVERTRRRLLRIFSGSELDEGGRGRIWTTALDSVRDAPWLGRGLGANGLVSHGDEGGYPHNLFLQVWLDGGLPALLLLAAAVALPLLTAARLRTGLDRDGQRLLLAVGGIFVFQVLEFSKSGNFYAARALVVFAAAMMAVAASGQAAREAS